jgi:hypothetical protein
LAERYFHDDAPFSLIKIRQLAELIAKDVAARQGILPTFVTNGRPYVKQLATRSNSRFRLSPSSAASRAFPAAMTAPASTPR